MATAEELLQNAAETLSESAAEVCVIDEETRTINVPPGESLFGVTGDKDVERKYFQCPKIVGDNTDLSQHQIYIVYVFTSTQNSTVFPSVGIDKYHCEDVKVSGDNITFSWKLSGNVLATPGFIAFKVMAAKNEGSNLKTKWNTAPAFGTVLITVPDGEEIAEEYPDIINQLFEEMEKVQEIATPEAMKSYVEAYMQEHPVTGGMTEEQEQKLNQNTTDIADLKSAMPKVDSTLSNTGEAADAKATGEQLASKAKNAGWNPEKIIGTDTEGNLIDMDVSQLDIKNLIFKSEDGKKYSVSVDNDGNVGVERQYELLGEDALVRNYQVSDGVVIDLVTETPYESVAVSSGYMLDKGKNIETLPVSELFPDKAVTIELVFKCDMNNNGEVLGTNYYSLVKFMYGFNDFTGENNNSYAVYSGIYSNFASNVKAAYVYPIRNSNILPLIDGENYYVAITIDENAFDYSLIINDKADKRTRDSSAGVLATSGLTRLDKFTLGDYPIKFIKMYDRVLSNDEISNNFRTLMGVVEDLPVESMITNGIVGLGSAVAVKGENRNYHYVDTETSEGPQVFNGINRNWEYTISQFASPTREVNEKYTSITIINKKIKATIGKKFILTAFPFPCSVDNSSSDDFAIEWTSSDPEKAKVIQGLVIPESVGEVTIIAKLSGTEISDSVTITISEDEEPTYNNMDVPELLVMSTPKQNWENICSAIQDAADCKYNKVTFPHGKDIWIYPPDEPFAIPTNICIDFNACNLRVVDSERSKSGYTFFEFSNCENSKIVNVNLYGERTNTVNPESYYSEQIKFLEFKDASNCWIENSNFYNPCGFNIVTSSYWNFWSGLPDYKNGQIYYTDFSFGKIADDGTIEDSDNWIVTDFKEFSTDETFKRFYFGCSDAMSLGFSQRLNDVAFYDSDKTLITVMRNVYRYESYIVPDGTKYWKFSIASDTLPTKNNNYADDNCVLRMAKSAPTIDCGVKNCSFFNTASGGISLTGESSNFHVENCYINGNGKKNAWAYDPEDGWYRMRHTLVDNCIFRGYTLGSGHGNFYVSSHFQDVTIRNDSEQTAIINSVLTGNITIGEKFTALFANCIHSKEISTNGAGRVIQQNNIQKSTYY